MAATFAGASGCSASQQHLVGDSGCQEKYWNDCLGKDAIIVQSSQHSPRASSAWSTQDGYLAYVDADRDTSLEVCEPNTLLHPASCSWASLLRLPACETVRPMQGLRQPSYVLIGARKYYQAC
jgi:hypothetical protein